MSHDENVKIWNDESWPLRKIGAWLFPLSWLAFLYVLVMLFSGGENVDIEHSYGSPLFYWTMMIATLVLFLYGLGKSIFCFYLASKTARSIKIMSKYCNAYQYFGKELSFPLDDVESVKQYNPKYFDDFITPLDNKGNNYLVKLNNSKCFYISGKIHNLNTLLSALK